MNQDNRQYQQTRWRLDALLSSTKDPVVDGKITEMETAVSDLENIRSSLSPDMSGEDFIKALQALERFSVATHVLGSYGSLWFSEDTQNQDALAFMGRMEKLITEFSNRILFFSLWWKGLENDAAERLLGHAGDLQYHFEKDRLFKEHTLSEPEEKIINTKDVNGVSALITLYEMITSKFVFELTVDEEKKELTRDELMTYVRNPSAEIRKRAYQELYRVYNREASVLGQIYTYRVRDWASEQVDLRRFTSPLSVRNLVNDIPDSVVDTLLDVCVEQASVFHRYFELKAGWLGLPKLSRYDLYAPVNGKSGRTIEYPKAVEMVLDSFQEFSPEVAEHAQRVFSDGHIDAEIRPRKRGGAFCAGILPGVTPWVLVNYTGEPRQVATLAHELGHAVHALLAADHSVLTFHSALPMAETASVFSEMLLTDRLLAEETDATLRRNLLAEAIDDAYATVLRQAYFVRFERDAHRMLAEGSTIDALSEIYLAQLQEQFGGAVEVSEEFRHEWISIPHIYHTPFYCYAYSFGQLLALSLYRRYKEEGTAFVSELLKILAYGGAAAPGQILSEAGIDMADPDFWRGGFKVIEGLVDAL